MGDVHAADPAALIACPRCDALHRARVPGPGVRLRCHRCHTVLATPEGASVLSVVLLASTSAILIVGAVFLPFLSLSVAGLGNESSIVEAAFAFEGAMLPLSLAVLALVVILPLVRMLLVVYALGPTAFGLAPPPHAVRVFRLSEAMRPWSMAEIFTIGTAIALVKVADLANVVYGPAFWMFAVLVLLVILQDALMSRYAIWEMLDAERAPLRRAREPAE